MLRHAMGGALLLVFAYGCNPSDFNSVTEKAPVVVIGKPSGFHADSLGFVVLPLPPPAAIPTIAGRLFFSGTDGQALGVADFDKDGKVTTHVATEAELSVLGTGNAGIVASAALRPDGVLVVGVPRFGQVSADTIPQGMVGFVTLTTSAEGKVRFAAVPGPIGQGHFGMAVGVGNIRGQGEAETAATGDDRVMLIGANQQTLLTASCPDLRLFNINDPYAHRPLVVGDFLAGGGDEVVLAGQTAGQGKVVFLSYHGLTNTFTCPAKVLTLGTTGQYGASLAMADLNADGVLDLAVGHPPERVHVYYGPLDAKQDPDLTISGEPGSDFGRRLQATRFGSVDLLVSAPTSSVEGKARVGKVFRFRIAGATGTLPLSAALVALSPAGGEEGDAFGTSLGEMHFSNVATCPPQGKEAGILWASTKDRLFTFFRGSGSAQDPRCFMQPK